MKYTLSFRLFWLPVALSWLACSSPPPLPPLKFISQMDTHYVNRHRFFFGHQSVGQNMLDGLVELGGFRAPRLLPPSDYASAYKESGIVHTLVGENMQPLSKLEHFEKILNDGVGELTEFAMLKLCYVDFDADTDIEALFQHYEATFQRLRERFPSLGFVHITVPLTTVESGLKSRLKKLFGKAPWGILENQKREAFNQKLRDTFGGKEPIFDLAYTESLYADGSRELVSHGGAKIPALIPRLTDDGGHLNLTGRAQITTAMVHYLGGLSKPPKNTRPARTPDNSI